MIQLTQQLCNELNLTYWQLNLPEGNEVSEVFTISRDEKELLRKILLAKGITLTDEILQIKQDGVVVINLLNNQLIFDDVTLVDSQGITHLAKVGDMLDSQEHKKHTWFKLKNIDL